MPDVIAKIVELGLPFESDVYQRTPIHYAAMHGQSTLLNNLISAGGNEVNQLDKYGLSELWYAASSRSIHSVQVRKRKKLAILPVAMWHLFTFLSSWG